jgi:hypothetical protein
MRIAFSFINSGRCSSKNSMTPFRVNGFGMICRDTLDIKGFSGPGGINPVHDTTIGEPSELSA